MEEVQHYQCTECRIRVRVVPKIIPKRPPKLPCGRIPTDFALVEESSTGSDQIYRPFQYVAANAGRLPRGNVRVAFVEVGGRAQQHPQEGSMRDDQPTRRTGSSLLPTDNIPIIALIVTW